MNVRSVLCFGLICAALCQSAPAEAQRLTGRVLEEGRESPVQGAAVILITGGGERRTETTSDSLGRFALGLPNEPNFFLQVVRLGYETARTPLISTASADAADIEVLVRPLPLPLPGIEVSVERRAERFLGLLGYTPETLGQRWIDREDIAAMRLPGLPKDLIRRQGIPGLWVAEQDPVKGRPFLCVTLRQRRKCALTVLNGAVINPEAAYWIDPRDLEAVAVLTPTEATTLYGTQATGGAVLMWTRTGGR